VKGSLKEVYYSAVKIAAQFGILDQTAHRNNVIRMEFEEMKVRNEGDTVEVIMERLGAKHFLSFARVREICYPRVPDPGAGGVAEGGDLVEEVVKARQERRTYSRRRR
jgi:hypothetical protein